MKSSLVALLACASLLWSPLITTQAPRVPSKDALMGMPQMSEAELLQFQKEIDSQIDEFVRSLPEEEQKQFYKDVEELSQVMSTMSEEELMQFMDQVFSEEMNQAPQPAPQPVTPVHAGPSAEVMPPIVVEERPKPVEVKQPTVTAQPLVVTIDSILNSIERFLLKAQIIPELSGDISNWAEAGKFKEWPHALTWLQLKDQLNELAARLKKLKEQDPKKTSLYRYLGYVNEPLHNNLERLAMILNEHEPRIEAPAFGLEKVSKNSRAAIRHVLDILIESLYPLGMIQALDVLFKEYEPREQELAKSEEEALKKALEAGKEKPKRAPTIQIGSGEGTGFVAMPSGDYDDAYGGPAYSGYYPGSYGDDYGSTPYNQDNNRETPGSPRSPQPSKGPRGASTPAKGKGEKAQQEKVTPGRASTSPAALTRNKPEKKVPEDKKAAMYLKNVARHLDKVSDLVEDSPNLQDLEKHVRSQDPINPQLIQDLRTAVEAYRRALDQAKALKLHVKKLGTDVASYYTEELKNKVAAHKEQLEPLISQVEALATDAEKLAADRRYAYFNDQEALEEAQVLVPAIATQVPEPVSLKELVDVLNELSATAAPKPKRTPQDPYGLGEKAKKPAEKPKIEVQKPAQEPAEQEKE